jgi:hypothetical protein
MICVTLKEICLEGTSSIASVNMVCLAHILFKATSNLYRIILGIPSWEFYLDGTTEKELKYTIILLYSRDLIVNRPGF